MVIQDIPDSLDLRDIAGIQDFLVPAGIRDSVGLLGIVASPDTVDIPDLE